VVKASAGDGVRTEVETLSPKAREEEIARMLSGAEVTEAARAAARALIA
jgi:DNA repair protein RecN (Recombination protein N)